MIFYGVVHTFSGPFLSIYVVMHSSEVFSISQFFPSERESIICVHFQIRALGHRIYLHVSCGVSFHRPLSLNGDNGYVDSFLRSLNALSGGPESKAPRSEGFFNFLP